MAKDDRAIWDTHDLAMAMQESVGKTFRYLRRVINEESRAHTITSTQTTALSRLAKEGSMRMSELAAGLELSNSACTAMIEQLEQRGLVVRRTDSDDKRSTRVEPTAEGRALHRAIASRIYGRVAEAMQRLPVAERYMVLGGFEAIASVID